MLPQKLAGLSHPLLLNVINHYHVHKNVEFRMMNVELKIMNYELSIINYELSIFNCQKPKAKSQTPKAKSQISMLNEKQLTANYEFGK
jgi:hypothetical protein